MVSETFVQLKRPILEFKRYSPVGGGSLTVHGTFFTPGGTVDIGYDFGGGFFDSFLIKVKADEAGGFDVTQDSIPCGEIIGKPGIGVIVTALDVSTGLLTKQYFSTPC